MWKRSFKALLPMDYTNFLLIQVIPSIKKNKQTRTPLTLVSTDYTNVLYNKILRNEVIRTKNIKPKPSILNSLGI